MADTTPRFGLPLLAASQAQKHVTHNDALIQADALVDLYFLDRDLAAPPMSPDDGDTYLVAAGATGAWAGHNGQIAYLVDGAWRFHLPFVGLRAYVLDEQVFLIHNGAAWVNFLSLLAFQNVPMLGVNTTADALNKLAVRSNAVLLTALAAADGGNGDIQAKLNKETAGDTASFLFQTGFSGRAEFGLTGDDNFHFKVSPDGSNWFESIVIDRNTGVATINMPGSVVQSVVGTYTANADITATIPLDDTIPQNNEGTQIISVAMTPRSATNKFRFRFRGDIWITPPGFNAIAAVFDSAAASAKGATFTTSQAATGAAEQAQPILLDGEYTPGNTSAHTITVRVGIQSGATKARLNGSTAARFLGGAMAATLVVEEIKA